MRRGLPEATGFNRPLAISNLHFFLNIGRNTFRLYINRFLSLSSRRFYLISARTSQTITEINIKDYRHDNSINLITGDICDFPYIQLYYYIVTICNYRNYSIT